MNAYADYVGADGHSYPEVAARAVRNAATQNPSPYYGYIRSGLRQSVYLFGTLPDAQGWFSSHIQQQPEHDYAAVFALSNLDAPVPGMEHFNRTPMVGNEQVGNVWPFFLGLPLGGAAGYFLRRYQEPPASRPNVTPLRDVVRPLLPGGAPPKVGDDPWVDFVGCGVPSVGDDPWVDFVGCVPPVGAEPWMDIVGNAPWVDIVGNAPWVDIVGNAPWVEFAPWVGAQVDEAAKRQASALARSLIQSAIRDIAEYTPSMPPANFYVWWLPAPSPSPSPSGGRQVTFAPSPQILSFTALDEAKDYVRALGQQSDIIARAVFDKTSRHWPSPVSWSKSYDPAHLAMISQYVTDRSSTAVGQYDEYMVGVTTEEARHEEARKLEEARNALRARARLMAQKRAGDAIGIIHMTRDNLWHALSFDSPDDADDWLNTATQDQNAYTYAAYFDKRGDSWPAPYIEKFGGYGKAAPGPRPRRAPIVGATRAEIEAYRARTQQIATAKPGAAVVVVITVDGRAHSQPFNTLDDAIDGLNRATSLGKANYAYAGAFDKDSNGKAYVQAENFGDASVPMAREGAAQ